MAKEETKKEETATAEPKPATIRCRVKRAIAFGGIRISPAVDGSKLIPAEADVPAELVAAYGRDYLEPLDKKA